MKQAQVVVAIVSLHVLGPASLAWAQDRGLAQIFYNKVKAGAQSEYEAGRQRHMQWHKEKADTWAWFTWEVLTGDKTGMYVVGTFDHAFQDLDGRAEFEAADAADSLANMGPHVESTTQSLYLRRVDMGGAAPEGVPLKFAQVLHIHVKSEAVNDFVESVKKMTEATRKTNYPIRPQWFQLFSGGMGPEFVLVYARNSWAELQPPDKTLDAMMEEALGKSAGAAALATLRRAILYTDSELLSYRPELSHVPAAP